MTRGARLRLLSVVVSMSIVVSCAPKPVPSGTGPRFPDFLFPTVSATLNQPDLASRQERAWALLQAGDVRASTKEFAAILKRAPEFYPSQTGLGYTALSRSDQQQALEWFERALARAADYTPALVGRGQAFLSLNREDEALRSFETAVSADPTLVDIRRRVEVLKFRRVQQRVQVAQRAVSAARWDEARTAYQKAIADSPESAFLYRELGAVERKTGETEAALGHFRQAVELEPNDAASLVAIGDIFAERGEFDRAMESYQAAQAVDRSAALDAKMAAVREKADVAMLPAEYRAIEGSQGVTRADLAALIGVRLKPLLESAGRRDTVVITDARGSWAAQWIQAVTGAGIMEVFPNHTFQPRSVVRRGDLAHAVGQLLNLIGAVRPNLLSQWQEARPSIADVGSEHLSYPAAALAVTSGVMSLVEGGAFDVSRPVGGVEAVAAIDRLELLASPDGAGRD